MRHRAPDGASNAYKACKTVCEMQDACTLAAHQLSDQALQARPAAEPTGLTP